MFFNITKFKRLILLIVLINFIKISNANQPINCYVCESSENVKCTEKLNEDDKDILSPCNKTECHIRIDENGKTVRGCGGCGGCEKTTSSCKTFPSSQNNVVFPEKRPKCHQCTDCETVGQKKFCEVYNDDKLGCYIGTDDKTRIIRGCESEKSIECNNKINCKTCKDDECEKTITLPKTKCIVCSDDKNCKRPAELPEGKCNVKVELTSDCSQTADGKTCYTYTAPNNTVTRGCAKNEPTEKNKGQITFCSGDKCNSECIRDINCAQCTEKSNSDCKYNKDEWYQKKCDAYTTVCHTCKNKDDQLERGCGKTDLNNCEYNYKDLSKFTCYRCRSDMQNQHFCAADKIEDTKLRPRACTNNPTKDDEKKCYIDNYDGIVIRGCISDIIQLEVRNRCTLDGKGKHCAVCNKENCNSGKVPNSSSYLPVSFKFLIIGCIILFVSCN